MKSLINFTTSEDDTKRYQSHKDLRDFYRHFGCDGLEVMPMPLQKGALLIPALQCPLIQPDMVVGVHACCIGDWMGLDRDFLLKHYRQDLEYAHRMQAEYVVFHVTQVDDEESFTYQMQHTDEEVILAACDFINELLEGQEESFYFLMENLWWPGLNFLRPEASRLLLENIHYRKKGFMLDTGHFLHTDLDLKSQAEGLAYLNHMLDLHEDLLPYIKGVHLHQSLSGSYVKEQLTRAHTLSEDQDERFCQLYEHIFRIDQHLPFTAPGVRALIKRIDPLYLTYEYITKSRKEHARYLQMGIGACK